MNMTRTGGVKALGGEVIPKPHILVKNPWMVPLTLPSSFTYGLSF